MWKTEDGKTWTDMTASLPPLPSAICGISSPSKSVVFASGTQYPNREAAVMHTADGGQTWNSISMAAHANLLIDTYFVDDLHGWVVLRHPADAWKDRSGTKFIPGMIGERTKIPE